MRYKYLLLLIAPVVLFSCKKEKGTTDSQPPVTPETPAPAGLLKEINIPNLPSPYYHFEYNRAGKITVASFASGLFMYDIVYSGDRLSEMKNGGPSNKHRLQYFYDNAGRADTIHYVDEAGVVYKRISLTYDGQKLVKLERELKLASGFITEKAMSMSYYADGNLLEITEYRPSIPITGQTESTLVDRFEHYDNKVNVDGFSLLHNEFFDQLVLLPGVQLQKNNPGKLTHTGDGINYQIDYTYTYNGVNLPLTRSGQARLLNGPDAGQEFRTNSIFSYY